eukprot:TRINITY_DN13004_c0_g2_i1.p1 TRINITY_DN13004_c0_g2~~TRINITY_DN13004_c0_g2_i1.p1  ORF type:complete len:357 (+),score=54.40 TRINITY_DN13004_c0_g2_i1:245-1315(+)
MMLRLSLNTCSLRDDGASEEKQQSTLRKVLEELSVARTAVLLLQRRAGQLALEQGEDAVNKVVQDLMKEFSVKGEVDYEIRAASLSFARKAFVALSILNRSALKQEAEAQTKLASDTIWSEEEETEIIMSSLDSTGFDIRTWINDETKLRSLEAWLRIYADGLRKHKRVLFSILSFAPSLNPELQAVDRNYFEMRIAVRDLRCNSCSRLMENASTCLICGAVFCLGTCPTKKRKIGNLHQHAWDTHLGCSVFFESGSSRSLYISVPRNFVMDSLFVDTFGATPSAARIDWENFELNQAVLNEIHRDLAGEGLLKKIKAMELKRGGISPPMRWQWTCLLYTSPSPRDGLLSRMPSSA